MLISEILKLDRVSSSIKKIDLFIVGCDKKSLEYYQALAYRNLVLDAVGKTNDALKSLYSLVTDFPKMTDEVVITLCDAIIEITRRVGRFDQTYKYMDIKKKRLRVSNSVLGLKDDITLAIATKNYTSAITSLKNYLNDEIDNEELLWANEELATIYYSLHDYDSYLNLLPVLDKIYQDNLDTNSLIQLYFSKLLIYDEMANHIQMIFDGNKLINNFDLDNEMKVKVATLLIKGYIKSKDHRRAEIIESNYEECLEYVSTDTAIAFAKICVELYTSTNYTAVVKHYMDLIEEFKAGKKTSRKKKALTDIVIPNVDETIEEEQLEEEPKIVYQEYEASPVKVASQFLALEKLFKTINDLDSKTKLRDIFRFAMIELEQIVSFETAYLLYHQQGYHGLYYKKGRAYDQNLEYGDLEDTLNFIAISTQQETRLDPHSSQGLKEINSKLKYEQVPYGIAIPFSREKKYYASIAFFGSKPFLTEELAHETLQLISEMINRNLTECLMQLDWQAAHKKMSFVYENMESGVKELLKGTIHLSKQATLILGAFEDMTEEEYKCHIDPEDLPLYNQVVEEIYQYMPNSKVVEYRYHSGGKTINVRETFLPSFENGNILLYSLIDDISATAKIQTDLTNLAYVNPITNLPTEVKLLVDLRESISLKKLTLAVVDVQDFKFYEEIYGITFINQMIVAIAEEFKNVFVNDFHVRLYHLGFDRYALLFQDTNDRRTIEHIINKAFEKVQHNMNILNSRIHLYFNAGVYRVSKSQNNITPEKVVSFSYDALSDAKVNTIKGHHIAHYDTEVSKLRYKENQLITHISEAIDHGQIGISYKQVVDIQNQIVFAYYASISLDNFEVNVEYMNRVIKRRRLEEVIDKYVIGNVSREMRQLRETTKAVLYVMIELSLQTLTDSFVAFMETQNQVYKTTKANIILVVEDASLPVVMALKRLGYKIASKNLIDVYQGYIDYYIFNVEQHGFVILPEIKQLCHEKNIRLIVSHVDIKEDVNNCIHLGVTYLYGAYYKKSIRMKKVIEKLS